MQYMVTGADGKEYGPTDLDTLKTWVAEGRLAPHTTLRDFNSGQTVAASAVPGLFAEAPKVNVPPAGVPYGRPQPSASQADPGSGMLVGVILRSVAAIVSFFFIGGLGFIFGAYAMVYAVKCMQSGSKYGILSLVIAGVALVAVGIGWAMKLTHVHA